MRSGRPESSWGEESQKLAWISLNRVTTAVESLSQSPHSKKVRCMLGTFKVKVVNCVTNSSFEKMQLLLWRWSHFLCWVFAHKRGSTMQTTAIRDRLLQTNHKQVFSAAPFSWLISPRNSQQPFANQWGNKHFSIATSCWQGSAHWSLGFGVLRLSIVHTEYAQPKTWFSSQSLYKRY